jgi:hypothetical protein
VKKLILSALLLLCSATAGNAGTIINILNSQDAEIFNLFGNTEINNSFSIGAGMAAGNSNKGTYRSLIEFDIAAYVPQGSTINSVTLSLYQGQTAGSGGVNGAGDATPRTIGLFRTTTAWGGDPVDGNNGFFGQATASGYFPAGDGAATWNYGQYTSGAWQNNGGDFVSTASAYAVGLDQWDQWRTWSSPQMAADVQGWLDGSIANYGWLLKNDDEDSSIRRDFRMFNRGMNNIDFNTGETLSSNSAYYTAFSAYAPFLTVDYTPAPVPVPPAAILFGSGLAGLGFLRRRFMA